MDRANPTKLLMPAGTVLKMLDSDIPLEGEDIRFYQQIVGSIMYLANGTRPDLAYLTGQLARFMATPALRHLQLSTQVLRFIVGTVNVGIVYQKEGFRHIYDYTCFTNATWGTDEKIRSFMGVVIKRYGGAVYWAAKRQKSTAGSTYKAEIMGINKGGKEIAWQQKLQRDIVEQWFIPTIWYDNAAAVDAYYTTKINSRAKHILIRYYYTKNDLVEKNLLYIKHIPGVDQTADMLTKQLLLPAFMKHSRGVGLGV